MFCDIAHDRLYWHIAMDYFDARVYDPIKAAVVQAAIQANAAVAVFSLEMSSDQLVMRLLSAESRVDLKLLRSGFLSDSDWPKLANAAQRLAAADGLLGYRLETDLALSANETAPSSSSLAKRDPVTTFWMANIEQRGSSPFGPAGYKVGGCQFLLRFSVLIAHF